MLKVPISIGELVDKITILEIKVEMLPAKQSLNCNNELILLKEIYNSLPFDIDIDFFKSLKNINQQLWNIEDLIRKEEKQQCFGDRFIQLARSVYLTNDKRSYIKKQINFTYNSTLIEEKSYEQYN